MPSKPLIVAEATHGAWGGAVYVYPPGATTCWNCVELSVRDGIESLPQSDDSGVIQPPGCAEPTFTGAGFDLSEIALQAVRAVVAQLLTASEATTIYKVELRDTAGVRIPPQWITRMPKPNPACGISH